MFRIFWGMVSYFVLGGFFTITTMSIQQNDWGYTFVFSTVFFFWAVAMFFSNNNDNNK